MVRIGSVGRKTMVDVCSAGRKGVARIGSAGRRKVELVEKLSHHTSISHSVTLSGY